MLRLFVFIAVIGAAALVYFQTKAVPGTITISNATAMPMGQNGDVFMVALEMANSGDAVALTGVSAPSADVSIMNPGQTGPLVVPAGGTGLLAIDGAHMMLSAPQGGFAEGSFQSVALAFGDGSTVVARVLRPVREDAMMTHGMMHGVVVTPAPQISFAAMPAVDATGFDVALALEHFTFARVPDDADHVAGQGHAHLYLNGLKLGRLYDDSFRIGALLPGHYALRIALNTNDHRPYLHDGEAVDLVFDFEIE